LYRAPALSTQTYIPPAPADAGKVESLIEAPKIVVAAEALL
jgi:hypothetical protein